MQNGRINSPPSLDLTCPQAKAELSKQDHKFMEWSVDNKEYGQEASTCTNTQIILDSNFPSYNLSWNE